MDLRKLISNSIVKIGIVLTLFVTSLLMLIAFINGVTINRTVDKVPILSSKNYLVFKVFLIIALVCLFVFLIYEVFKLIKHLKNKVIGSNNSNTLSILYIITLVGMLILNIFTLLIFDVNFDKYNLYSYALSISNIIIIITSLVYIIYNTFINDVSEKITTQVISEGSVLAALAIVLSLISKMIPGLELPMGGSFSLSMLPLFIFSFRRGPKAGFIVGLIYGLINLLTDGIIYHWGVIFFDYLLPFSLLMFAAGLFSKKAQEGHLSSIVIGVLIGGFIRYIFHGFSGVLFFSDSTSSTNAWVFSFIIYNLPYMLVSTIGTLIITILLRKQLIYTDTRIR